MPGFIKGKRDEKIWAKAKRRAQSSLGKSKLAGDDFRLANWLYHKMKDAHPSGRLPKRYAEESMDKYIVVGETLASTPLERKDAARAGDRAKVMVHGKLMDGHVLDGWFYFSKKDPFEGAMLNYRIKVKNPHGEAIARNNSMRILSPQTEAILGRALIQESLSIFRRHSNYVTTKPGSWDDITKVVDFDAADKDEISHLPLIHYPDLGKSTPGLPQYFVAYSGKRPNEVALVDTQGYDYPRYMIGLKKSTRDVVMHKAHAQPAGHGNDHSEKAFEKAAIEIKYAIGRLQKGLQYGADMKSSRMSCMMDAVSLLQKSIDEMKKAGIQL